MSTKLRTHGKSFVVWVLLAVLVLGLGGFGITSFSGGMSKIGSVGDTEISTNDYARALQSQTQRLQQQMGRAVTPDEAKAFGLPAQVQAQLFADAALTEQARRLGLSVGDAEVAKQITDASAFHSATGGFDRDTYKMVLRQQGYSEGEFETRVRDDITRSLFRGLIAGGATAPKAQVQAYVSYLADKRPFAWAEITPADLTEKPAQPTDDQLQAFYKDHIAQFTAPETRDFTYAWLTPELLKDEAAPSDADLRAAYDAKKATYQQPERRMVDRLVFPTEADAQAARARIDAGSATFAEIAKERGLDVKDIDLGEVEKSELGAAGDAVFALTAPGVAGPIKTDLGPALYAMNGILPAETTSFEDAKPDLEAEATIENGRKMIQGMSADIQDKLAGGATLEDLAKDTKMQLGTIAMTADTKDGIAAYQAFRDAAAKATTGDFPALENLDDGGVFALRLDKVTPPAPIPFDQARDKVAAAWSGAELTRMKTARAQEIVAAVSAGATLPSQGVLVTNLGPTARTAFIEGLPADVVKAAFATEPGKPDVAMSGDRVFVVVPGETIPADPKDADVEQLTAQIAQQLDQTLANDVGSYYATAVEGELPLSFDQSAATAVQAQMR